MTELEIEMEVTEEAPSSQPVPQPRYVGAALKDQAEEELAPYAAGAQVHAERCDRVAFNTRSSRSQPVTPLAVSTASLLYKAGVPPPPATTAMEPLRRKRCSSVAFNTRSSRSQPVTPLAVSTASLLYKAGVPPPPATTAMEPLRRKRCSSVDFNTRSSRSQPVTPLAVSTASLIYKAGVPPPPATTAMEPLRRKRCSSVCINTRSGRSQTVSPSSVSTTSLLGLPEKLKNITNSFNFESTRRRKVVVKKLNFEPLQEEKYPSKRSFTRSTDTSINLNIDEVGSILKDRTEEEFVNNLYYDALANSKTYDESNGKDQKYETKNSPLRENNNNDVVNNGKKILPITEIGTIDRNMKQSNKLLSPRVLIDSLELKKYTSKGKDNIENTVFVENVSVIPDSDERNVDNSNIRSSQELNGSEVIPNTPNILEISFSNLSSKAITTARPCSKSHNISSHMLSSLSNTLDNVTFPAKVGKKKQEKLKACAQNKKTIAANKNIKGKKELRKTLKSFVASKEAVCHIPDSDDLNDIYSEKDYNTTIHTETPIHSIKKRKLYSPKDDFIVQCVDKSALSSEEEEQINSKNIRKDFISNTVAVKGKEEKPLSTNDLFDQIKRSSYMTDNVPTKKKNEIALYNNSTDSEKDFQPNKFRSKRSVSEESSAGGNSNAIKRTKRTVNKVKERSRKKLNNKTVVQNKKEHGTKVDKLLQTKSALDDEKMRIEVPTDAGLDTSICFENCVQTEKLHGDIVPVGLQNIEMEEMVPENNVGTPILFLSETPCNDTEMFTKKSLLSVTLVDKSSEKKMFSNKHESIPRTKHPNINKKERGKKYIKHKSKKHTSGESNEVKHLDVGQTSESLKPVNIVKGPDVNINIIKKNISESTTILVDSNIDFDEIITEREYRTKMVANESISGNMDSHASISKSIKVPSENNEKVHIQGSKTVKSKKRHSDSEMEMPSINKVNQIARTEFDHINLGIKDEHVVNLLETTKTLKMQANKANKLFEEGQECPLPSLVVEKDKRNDGLNDLNLSNLSNLIQDVNSYKGKLQRTSKPDAIMIMMSSGDKSPANIACSTPHDKTLKKKSCLTINSSGDNHSDFTSEKSIVTNAYSPITGHGDFNQSPPNVIDLESHESGRHFELDLENSRDREYILEFNGLNSRKSKIYIDNLENDSIRSERISESCSKDYISGKGTLMKSANLLKKAISSPLSSPVNDVHLLFRKVKSVDSSKEQADIDVMENDIIRGDLISNRSEDYVYGNASNCKTSANVLKSVNLLKKAISSPSSPINDGNHLLFRNVKPVVFSPIMITNDLRSSCRESTSYSNIIVRDLSTEAKRQSSDHDLDIFAGPCPPAGLKGSAKFTECEPLKMRDRVSKKAKSCECNCHKNILYRGGPENNENDDKGKPCGDSSACTDMRATMMQAIETGLVEADRETNRVWVAVVSRALQQWREVGRRHELEHRELLQRLEEQRNRENAEKEKVLQQLTEQMLREARRRTARSQLRVRLLREDLDAMARRCRGPH